MRIWTLFLALFGMLTAVGGWSSSFNSRPASLFAKAQSKVICANPSCKKPNKATNNACENCGQPLYENVNVCKTNNLRANNFCTNTEIKRLARSIQKGKCTIHKAPAPSERIVRVKVCPLSQLEAGDDCPSYDVIEFPESKRPGICNRHGATIQPNNDSAGKAPKLRWKVGDQIERTMTLSGEMEFGQMTGTMTSIETIVATTAQDFTVKSVTTGKMSVVGNEVEVPSEEQTQRLLLNGALAEVLDLEAEVGPSMFAFFVLPGKPFSDGLKWNYLLPKSISHGPFDLNHDFVAQTKETINGQSCYRVTATFREVGGIGTGRGTFWVSLDDFDTIKAECSFSNYSVDQDVVMSSLKISLTSRKR